MVGACLANTVSDESRKLLNELQVSEPLARALRVHVRGRAAVFSVAFGADDEEPVFRVRLMRGELHLDARQQERWVATPEHGGFEHIAHLLKGPLRFLWHLHAEDALDSRGSG